MKINKEDVLMTSIRLFAERGYDAVSMSMIAGDLGVTKGALYRHFRSKQDIFERLLDRMVAVDAERAMRDELSILFLEKDADSYEDITVDSFCDFVMSQFDFWTTNEFAVAFRRMATLEQFKNPKMMSLYQDIICEGPIRYSTEIFREMLMDGRFNMDAAEMGPNVLATMIFAPLKLSIEMTDGGSDRMTLRENLMQITEEFKRRWTAYSVVIDEGLAPLPY